jgi:hypothetical protein
MLPRHHIILGAIFTIIFWLVFPWTEWYYLALIFLSSFLIDFDHYMDAVLKTKKLSLFNAFDYHRELEKKELAEYKRGIRRKGDFHIFHTVEFHALTFALGLVWLPFLYIFIGMFFHSAVDLISLAYEDGLYRREYFLTNWIRKKLKH